MKCLAFATALALAATAAPAATLVSHFPFDSDFTNSANPALNSTGQSGGVGISSDAVVGSGSVRLDGNDDLVWAGSNAVPGAGGAFYQGTVAFWLKSNPGATPGAKNFMGVNNGDFATTGANDRMAFNVQSNGAGSLQIFIRSQNGTESNNVLQFRHQVGSTFPTDWNNGQWNHVAFTWRVTPTGTDTRQIYLNGIAVPTSTVLGTLEADPVKSPLTPWETPGPGFLIGAVNNRIPTGGTASNLFGGWIDDVRIYDDALTLAEINALPGLPVPEPSALAVAAAGAVALLRRRC